MLIKDGEGTIAQNFKTGIKNKVPLPVAYHLKQAVGALTLHTGRNYIRTIFVSLRK